MCISAQDTSRQRYSAILLCNLVGEYAGCQEEGKDQDKQLFWEGLSSGQILQEGEEEELMLSLLQSSVSEVGSSGLPSESWGHCLQKQWLIEVRNPCDPNVVSSLATHSRPGEFRVSSIIASEF